MIGDSDNILARVKRVLPNRWFSWIAPQRDAIIGGLSDLAAWCFDWVTYARAQMRLATVFGIFLDIYAYDFLGRVLLRNGATDDAFRSLVQATILKERVTRQGMSNAILALTGNAPVIFEPWSPSDGGAYSNAATGQIYGQFGYGVGRGGWGNIDLPGQVFMKVVRGASSGVANITGYGFGAGGYWGPNLVSGQSSKGGNIAYISSYTRQQGITDDMIETLIKYTKPTGAIVWLQFV